MLALNRPAKPAARPNGPNVDAPARVPRTPTAMLPAVLAAAFPSVVQLRGASAAAWLFTSCWTLASPSMTTGSIVTTWGGAGAVAPGSSSSGGGVVLVPIEIGAGMVLLAGTYRRNQSAVA